MRPRLADDLQVSTPTLVPPAGCACAEVVSDNVVSANAGSAAATAMRLKQRGTEDHLGELDEHRLVVEIVERTIAGLPPALQRLWHVHYVEDRALAAYAAEQGISDATAERHHKKLRAAVEAALFGEGIDGVPDVE